MEPVVKDLLNSCFLPKLKEDLDNIPIEKGHFKSYHDCLEVQLPILYDWIQQTQPMRWSFLDEEYDSVERKEIQANLILLLCEICAPESLYRLDNSNLIKNAETILEKFDTINREVEDLILKYYEEKLHKDSWKKQIGSVHGFVKYMEFLFSDSRSVSNQMNHKSLMFCLSVALNIRMYYETHYKFLSTTLFRIMLEHGNPDDILSMNIQGVIYDAIYKDLHIMDSISFIELQWNCLLSCYNFYKDMDSFTWTKLDDCMEILLRNIPLAPNSLTSISLMKFVSKFMVYFNINRVEFEDTLRQDLMENTAINNFRQLASSNTSYTCYRWAKKILEIFVLESYRLMQSIDTCREMLLEIHRCYIVTMFPIPLSVLEPHLVTYYEKFTAVLMEVIKVQKYKDDILQIITSMLETFYYHLTNCTDLPNLMKFRNAYQSLLDSDVFKKYKIIC
ncbi:uncharacterized protein LOC142222330 [Haematobia irritans]|uniref:uncharacterized protein LOC142222330 n=1 Tax=Haematobia irritans TaxID=7368 RepID=UPI003F50D3B8